MLESTCVAIALSSNSACLSDEQCVLYSSIRVEGGRGRWWIAPPLTYLCMALTWTTEVLSAWLILCSSSINASAAPHLYTARKIPLNCSCWKIDRRRLRFSGELVTFQAFLHITASSPSHTGTIPAIEKRRVENQRQIVHWHHKENSTWTHTHTHHV